MFIDIAAMPHDLHQAAATFPSVAQHWSCQLFQLLELGEFDFAALDLDKAFGLETTQDAAYCFRRQPQIIGHVGATHREMESSRGKTACRIAP